MTDYYHQLLTELIQINSCTGFEKNIALRLIEHHRFKNYPIFIQTVELERFNVLAKSPLPSRKRLLFCSHIDTVPPHLNFSFDKKNKIYYGRGACDTKGGIISLLKAGDLLANEQIAIDYLWVISEETDHLGAIQALKFNDLINEQYLAVLLCEPTNNRLVSAQKGILKAKIQFQGKNAHSGYPELGLDANKMCIETSWKLLQKANTLADDIYGNLDFNIGLVQGGQAANVISDSAEITCLARTNSHHEDFKAFLESVQNHQVNVQWINDQKAISYPHTDSIDFIEKYVAKFNTDAVYLSQIAPVFLLGPGYIIHAHSENEHISEVDIKFGVQHYLKLSRYLYDRI